MTEPDAKPNLAVIDGGNAATTASTTWAAIDLAPILAGEHTEAAPTLLARTDGHCLIYERRVHAVQGEPESLKGWLAIEACAQLLALSKPALYADFEDSAASIVGRLRATGISREAITAGLIYVRPDEPLADAAVQDLQAALDRQPALAVIDGLTEAFARQGLNPLDNADVAAWLDVFPRRLIAAGAAVLMLDHVVKDREQRGRYALGAQHKLAGVDVAYSMRIIEPFAPGREGLVAIKVEKDRPGRVREFAPEGQAALLRATSQPDRGVVISLEPPDPKTATFRPTVLMERISAAVESDPGMSKRAIREAVRGKTGAVDLALELLIAEGYIDAKRDGQAHRHYPLKPYHEDDDATDRDPVTQPCPNRDPDTGATDRDPVTLPLRGESRHGSRSPGHAQPANRDRAYKCDCNDGGTPSDTFPGSCDVCYGALSPEVLT